MTRYSTWKASTTTQHEYAPAAISIACSTWLSRVGLTNLKMLGDVETVWEEVVGSEVAHHAQPIGIEDDILIVAVDHPSWATELSFCSEQICHSLQLRLESSPARRIRVTIKGQKGLQ